MKNYIEVFRKNVIICKYNFIIAFKENTPSTYSIIFDYLNQISAIKCSEESKIPLYLNISRLLLCFIGDFIDMI